MGESNLLLHIEGRGRDGEGTLTWDIRVGAIGVRSLEGVLGEWRRRRSPMTLTPHHDTWAPIEIPLL
jgi:hypothetical protein